MGKYTVTENGKVIHTTRGLNDACCFAGERADKTRLTADIGTVIEVTHPTRTDLPLYRLVTVELFLSGQTIRDWSNQ